MFDKDKDIATLETLTTTLIDSCNGYRDAAQDLDDDHQFRSLFLEMAEERTSIADQLRDEIRRNGGDAPDDGSLMGKLHQRFMDMKAAVTGRDDKKVIDEVERGEDYLKEKFEAALSEAELSTEARSVIDRAWQSVRRGHDRVSAIKHGMEAAAGS